ncbi:MAG: DUF362 domain-containing protein [Euryarchaeota archaeon]|nr:DUF362 domain-containing protein [Euryarchaeota archaeon]
MPVVGVVRAAKPDVRAVLDVIDFEPEECEVLVLKPHLCCSMPHTTGATTDPEILRQVLSLYEGLAGEVYVVESDGYAGSADRVAEELGIAQLCELYDATWVNLSREPKVPVERDYLVLENPFPTPRTLLKADMLINLPKMKTHSVLTVSLGLANMLRVIPGRKERYHHRAAEAVCDVLMIRKPDLTITDGIIGMEGSGPMRGTPKHSQVMLASTDVVANDTVACRVMGINPVHVEHIIKAGYYGFGEYTERRITVRGESIDRVRSRYLLT